MLDFETCMQLKNAGFPQNTEWFCAQKEDQRSVRFYEDSSGGWSRLCACPTTDDLLLELQPKLRNLFFLGKLKQWVAYGPKSNESGHKNPCVYGKTAAEALANLYLMLNKPKEKE